MLILVDINRLRVNFQIRIPQVRVMQNGEQLGIMPTEKPKYIMSTYFHYVW